MVSLYLSQHDPHLAAERQSLGRVIQAFAPHFSLASPAEAAKCQVYWALLGQELTTAAAQELEGALRAKKDCHLWALDLPAAERGPQVGALLRHLQTEVPTHFYRSPADLRAKAYHYLRQRWEAEVAYEWSPPPLPLRAPWFVGREDELGRLAGIINSSQPLILHGESGLGKTALALEAAYRLRPYFAGGVVWLDGFEAEAGRGPGLQGALRHLARLHPSGRAALQEGRSLNAGELRGWLAAAPGKVLVIVDDLRHISPLRELRAALPATFSLLVTSPGPLNEVGWQHLALGGLDESQALAYLNQCLNTPPGLAIEALRPLLEVGRSLKGHPLSLNLAAAWMERAGGWGSALVYQGRLNHSTQTLGLLAPGLSHREGAEKALAVFYNSLGEGPRHLWQAAAVFPPGVAFSAAALMAVSALPAGHQDSALAELRPHLLSDDETRQAYVLHERAHQYGAAILAQDAARFAYEAAYVDYYQSLAQQTLHEKPGPENPPPPDSRHFYQAFLYACRRPATPLLNYILAAGPYLQSQHYGADVRIWLDRALELSSESGRDYKESAPTLLRSAGDLALRLGHHGAAQEFYERALLMYYESKSLSGQANTLKALGDLRAQEGHLAEAQDYYDRTLLIYAQIDFQLGRANTLKSMGDLSLKGGDLPAARQYYQRTLELYEQIDFQLGQAHTLQALGQVAWQERDFLQAQEALEAALALFREINFQSQAALSLLQLGELMGQMGQGGPALELYEQALRLYRHLDDPKGQAETLERVGLLQMDLADYPAAQAAYEEARALYRDHQHEGDLARVQVRLAEIYWRLNLSETAIRAVLQAMQIYQNMGDKEQLKQVRRHLRELARRLGSHFSLLWNKITQGGDLPDWLKLAPATALEQGLVYAVRDFMLAGSLESSRRLLEENQDLLLNEEADEVFARMLRQYAGQAGPTKQIDRYRNLLQRARQVGIAAAFEELQQARHGESDTQAKRLSQTLDAYDEALHRLRDIPLVYASIQLNRASTLRELAALPNQDRLHCLQNALAAYDDALLHQGSAPLDYAQTQTLRAQTLLQMAALPEAPVGDLLLATLEAYTDALQHQHDLPHEYARTQMLRANTLYELALLPQQKVTTSAELLQQALGAYDDCLKYWRDEPLDYARAQSQRARLLYAMAGIPNQDFLARMMEALRAYDEALEFLRDHDQIAYAQTQSYRVALLRDMAGLPGEDRAARLYQALAACNESLRFLTKHPALYAQTQLNRAHLLRELAGLRGEHRLARMRESLATYNEVLGFLSESPLEYASVQQGRAALLRELANLGGENAPKRLRESLEACGEALLILEKLPQGKGQLANVQRVLITLRKDITQGQGEATFEKWWQEIAGGPLPEWL
jgi:tetratricopeptide (TPR) repeat protein